MAEDFDPQYDDSAVVKNLRDRGDKAEKRVKELEDQLAKLTQKTRQTDVADILKAKNVNPKVAKYILRDLDGDVTEDAVVAWLKEDGELFGIKLDENAAAPDAQEPTNVPDPQVQAAIAAMRQMANTEQGGQNPLADDATMARLQSPDLTPTELFKLLGSSDVPAYYDQNVNKAG